MRGNRRSENNPEGAGSAAGDPTARIAPAEPQRSSQGLQFTGFTPIQPLPSIKEVTAQTQTIVQQIQTPQPPIVEMQNVATPQSAPAETVSQTVVEPQNVASPQPESVETASQPVVETQNVASQQPETVENVTTPVTETFEECWGKMVDVIFQKKPAFYHQLRDYLPRYERYYLCGCGERLPEEPVGDEQTGDVGVLAQPVQTERGRHRVYHPRARAEKGDLHQRGQSGEHARTEPRTQGLPPSTELQDQGLGNRQ